MPSGEWFESCWRIFINHKVDTLSPVELLKSSPTESPLWWTDRILFSSLLLQRTHTHISFYNHDKKTDPHNEGILTRFQHQRQKRPDRLASKEASFPIENGDIINTVTFQQQSSTHHAPLASQDNQLNFGQWSVLQRSKIGQILFPEFDTWELGEINDLSISLFKL